MAPLTFKELVEEDFYGQWEFACDEFVGSEEEYDEWVTVSVLNESGELDEDECKQVINDNLSEYLLMVRKIIESNETCDYGNIEMVVNKYRWIIQKEYKDRVLNWEKYMELWESIYHDEFPRNRPSMRR